MKKELLIQMLEHASKNQVSKKLNDLALQIAVDPELLDEVNINSFSNEFYSVRDIRSIKYCINFFIL